MPMALGRACALLGCGGMAVARGRCVEHAREREQRRGSASARGYDAVHWRPFRLRFARLLVAAGIAPICGAALPGGPAMAESQCRADGRVTWTPLHLDHDPPLRAVERADWRAVCDPMRVGWLCASCHDRRTRRQQDRGEV